MESLVRTDGIFPGFMVKSRYQVASGCLCALMFPALIVLQQSMVR